MSDAVRRIRLFALDVDGVLTDNGVYLGEIEGQRVELKRFDIQDGLGLRLLDGAGIAVVLVTARPSAATAVRAAELRITELLQTADGRKVQALEPVLGRLGMEWKEVAYLGDDLADVLLLRRVGYPMAVANAVPEVKALAAHVTDAPGGRGAVRQAVEHLLKSRGEWDAAVERYLREREGAAA